MNDAPALRVYLDARVLIYVVEGAEPFKADLQSLLRAVDDGLVQCLMSELTVAEVMVKPYASKDESYISALLSIGTPLRLLPIDREVLENSARLRAALGGKRADAIHVATACLTDCSHFLTEDARIKVPEGITIVGTDQIDEMLASVRGAP